MSHMSHRALLYKVLPVEYISHFFPLFYIAFVVRNMNNLFSCCFWLFIFTYPPIPIFGTAFV